MIVTRMLASLAMIGAAAVLLAGCGATSAGSGAASDAASKPAHSAAAGVPPRPFNSGKLLAGNASPTFPDGEQGMVSVVAEGVLRMPGAGAVLPIVYRNNTEKSVERVDVTASAQRDGKVVATGESEGPTPSQVQPGEIGLTVVAFADAASLSDPGVTYRFHRTLRGRRLLF